MSLSYAHEQRTLAEEISVALSVHKHDVFFDRSTLKAGVEYHAAIQTAIEESDLFVFLISPDSLKRRRYTLTELGIAKEKWSNPSGNILPVSAKPTPDSTIDPYLRAVAILDSEGNLAVAVADRANELLENKPQSTNSQRLSQRGGPVLEPLRFSFRMFSWALLTIMLFFIGLAESDRVHDWAINYAQWMNIILTAAAFLYISSIWIGIWFAKPIHQLGWCVFLASVGTIIIGFLYALPIFFFTYANS